MDVTAAYSVGALLAVASSRHGPEGHLNLPTTGSRDRRWHDHLANAAVARDWLGSRREFGIPAGRPTARELAQLREIREAAQALAKGRAAEYRRRLDSLLRDAVYRLDRERRLRPAVGGWSGFVAGLVAPLVELESLAERLRVCGNPGCRWLFVDASSNRTRRWCDPAACGNRMKVRRWRRRRPRSSRKPSGATSMRPRRASTLR